MATEAPAARYVERFSGFERALHWLLAITFLAMLATGLILSLPSLAQIAANRVLWKSIHLGAALAFWAGLVALVPGNGRAFRAAAREIDRFDDDDRRWLEWAITRRGAEPPQGRFNAGQKLNTAVVCGLMIVFTISGTLMYLQEASARFRGQTSAILVHDLATWVALPLVLGHLWLAMAKPSTRHSMRGILLGSVRRDWALRHHRKWVEEDQPAGSGTGTPSSP